MITRNRTYLALAAAFLVAVILIAVYGCTGAVAPTATDELELADKLPPNEPIMVVGDILPDNSGSLFRLTFPTVATLDVEPRPDGVRGRGRWVAGSRPEYDTAIVFWEHEDPNQHPFVTGIRIVVQSYHGPDIGVRINDRGLPETPTARPYPYEPGSVTPVDCSRPGATFEFIHIRPDKVRQVLARFVVPAVSPENPKVRWCYQLGGFVVAEHDDVGPVARIIMSGMHPSYTYRVQGVTAANALWIEEM